MYRSNGYISFLLRRVTGIALVLYLFVHMLVIGSALQGAQVFDTRLAAVQTPFFKIAEGSPGGRSITPSTGQGC
jgi:succinate dehydrogenase/fumarate reductase cytochrome b subunit